MTASPHYTPRNLLWGVDTPSDQLTATTVICLIHSVIHTADYQALLVTQIGEECIGLYECGLILLSTEVCPRCWKYSLKKNIYSETGCSLCVTLQYCYACMVGVLIGSLLGSLLNLQVQITNCSGILQIWKFILLRTFHKETVQMETLRYSS